MLSDKYKVKAISRKVILAWKRASETSNVTWEEIFPVICALYELDDNFHKDESFQNLKIESMPFYAHFKDILKDLNLANFNIHYFRKLTKYLLKTYLEANKELRLIQQQKIATGQEITSNDITIPDAVVDELVCLYKELKKADNNESVPQISRGVPTSPYHRRNRSGQYSYGKSSLKTEIGQGYEEEKENGNSEVIVKPKKSSRRPLPPIPKKTISPNLSSSISPRLISGMSPKFIPGVSPKLIPGVSPKYITGTGVSPKFMPGSNGISPKLAAGVSSKISPILSPTLSPLLPPTLSPPMCYNDNVTVASHKKLIPANANVITIKHPKKSNLRKIKRKSLKIATTPNGSFTEDMISPTESFSTMSHISPLSISKLEEDFVPITGRNYPICEEVYSKADNPKLSINTSPRNFTEYPTRTASLSPSSKKRISFPKRASSQNNARVDENSYTVNPSTSQKLGSEAFASCNYERGREKDSIKNRGRARSMDVLAYHPHNNVFKASPSSIYRKSPVLVNYEDGLPCIPPFTNNYVENVVATKMSNTVFEEPLSPPIHPPTINSPPLSQIPMHSQFTSPPLSHYPSPSQSFSQIQYPTQSPYMSQSINTSFTSLNSNNADTYYDVGDILDGYADDVMDNKCSPILVNNSPHFSLFSNNNLTQEGALYAKGTSLKSVETLGFMDVGIPGTEGIPEFGEKDDSFVKSEDSQWEEGQISTVITDSTVIDSLESDLLNHKVQSRKSIGSSISGSIKSTPLKSEMALTSIEEKDEGENKNEATTSDEKQEEKESLEMMEDLKEKKQQFRLSFLTSKSSNSTLKRSLGENKLKESQTIDDNEDESSGKSSNKNENGNENDDDWESKKVTTETSSKSSDTGSQSPKTVTPYFVHPAQLYHMLQVLCDYAISGLPRRVQPISERWVDTSNSLALSFWEILKYKEDVISQIIIYATFYDQVKSRAFPLHDPDRVFLKELISSMNVRTTPTLTEIQAKKAKKNRNRSKSDPYLPDRKSVV